MNELYTQEFISQAKQAGVPQEKVAQLLQRVDEISKRKVKTASVKTASAKLDIVDSLIQGAGLQKTASSVSYVQGVLNEAFTNGANVAQAINFTKQALDATASRINFMEKVRSIQKDPQLSQYAEGFILAAKTAGMTNDEAVSLLVDLVEREKHAEGGDPMFKQAPPAGAGGPPPGDPAQGAPEGDPAAGAPPMPPGGPGGDPSQGGPGGNPEEAQILQMLQSLPPEEQQQIIQQLLAAISGGQGGPGGPGAGGPPPGMAGPGGPGGAPQPGGPQGPA